MRALIILPVLLSLSFIAGGTPPAYKNPDLAIEERIEDLLGRMTLHEKIMQTTQGYCGNNINENNISSATSDIDPNTGSFIYYSTSPVWRNRLQRQAMEETRLGIPILFGHDVIHGYRTMFPIPIGQSCSWNPGLVEQACRISAREAWLSGVDWTFSPMIDVARDHRWGRVSESYGEDPYSNSVYCVAAVRGYQTDDLTAKYSIAACLKHFAGYSMSEGGRDYHYTDFSDQTLWETFLPPYEAGIRAGAATVMSSFNDIAGTPASANKYLLTDVLKNKWGHDGFVVSDWNSVIQLTDQGVARDNKHAAELAMNAGLEMDMVDNAYRDYLAELIDEGRVNIERLDDAVRRILRIKFRLGLFDAPYVDELPEEKRYRLPEDIRISRRLAAESMVLLKNDGNLLPLTANTCRIAVIGPVATDASATMGSWEALGRLEDVTTILDGITTALPLHEVNYSPGCDFDGDDRSGFSAAAELASASDVVILCMGEKKNWSGENATRSTLALPAIQEELIEEISLCGKPVVFVFTSGRAVELARIEPKVDAIIAVWQPGTEGGSALADILCGVVNPSGRLSVTFPKYTGQQPSFYNQRQPARPGSGLYQDIDNTPMYKFGYGLSYTTFEYGNITLSADKTGKEESILLTMEVSNTGNCDGEETVFWFITDPVASISRPVKELKYFEKKEIPAGGKALYRFEIVPERDLSFPDKQGNMVLESGEFIVSVKDKKARFVLE